MRWDSFQRDRNESQNEDSVVTIMLPEFLNEFSSGLLYDTSTFEKCIGSGADQKAL